MLARVVFENAKRLPKQESLNLGLEFGQWRDMIINLHHNTHNRFCRLRNHPGIRTDYFLICGGGSGGGGGGGGIDGIAFAA